MKTQEQFNPGLLQLTIFFILFASCTLVYAYGLTGFTRSFKAFLNETLVHFEQWIQNSQWFH